MKWIFWMGLYFLDGLVVLDGDLEIGWIGWMDWMDWIWMDMGVKGGVLYAWGVWLLL